MEIEHVDSLVVGAGIAGSTAALLLSQAGYSTLCVDKGRGAGGRLSTRRTAAGVINHGAPSFEVSTAAFEATVSKWLAADLVKRIGTTNVFTATSAMNAIIKHQQRTLNVRFQHRLVSLLRTSDKWLLKFENEIQMIANRVILALPTPQIEPILDSAGRRHSELATIAYAPQWVVLVAGMKTPLSNLASLDGLESQQLTTGGLCIYMDKDWSKLHLEWSRQQVIDWVTGRCEPALVNAQAHLWRYGRVDTFTPSKYLHFCDENLWVCGDGFGGSGVDAAYNSGRFCAQSVIAKG